MNSFPTSSLRSALRATALGALALLLAGCLSGYSNNNQSKTANTNSVPVEDHSTVGHTSTDPVSTAGSKPDARQPSQAQLSKNKVTLALLDKSDLARSQGNLKEAVIHVERAIRINPRRADLWVHLARLQLALNAPSIAEGYARKAISLAGSRLDWKRDAWLVIADAKQAQGMVGEADAIRQRWRTAQG